MNGDVGRWALEFIVGNSVTADTNLIEKLINQIPVSDTDFRLKMSILFKSLQNQLSAASFQESFLHTLDIIEEIHSREGFPVTAAMSAAYCAVAVECTLKFLHLDVSAYRNAVNRIWRHRVLLMEPSASRQGSLLFSTELKRWKDKFEASLSDPQALEILAAIDTRKEAIMKVKAYLAETWPSIGPSFLQLAVEQNNQQGEGPSDSIQQHRDDIQKEVEPSTACTKIDSHIARPELSMKDMNQNQELPVERETKIADVHTCQTHGIDNDEPVGKETKIADAHTCQTHGIDNNEAATSECRSSRVHHPSLIERNSTACTSELDDSIDGSPKERLHLPSPKRKKHSPLKRYEPAKITIRRKKKRWSQTEEKTLRDAVEEFGRGNWKAILNAYKDLFEERTEVDLKDKWRNMTRYGSK